MKKLLVTLTFVVLSIITGKAQNSVVYFDYLSDNIEVGLGYSKEEGKMILSLIQNSKKRKDLRIQFYKADGTEYFPIKDLKEPSIIIIEKATEADYFISRFDLIHLYQVVKVSDYVLIGGQKFSATVFVSILKYLEDEYTKPKLERTWGMNPRDFMFRRIMIHR